MSEQSDNWENRRVLLSRWTTLVFLIDWIFLFPDLHLFFGTNPKMWTNPNGNSWEPLDQFLQLAHAHLPNSEILFWVLGTSILLTHLRYPLSCLATLMSWVFCLVLFRTNTLLTYGLSFFILSSYVFQFIFFIAENKRIVMRGYQLFFVLIMFNSGLSKLLTPAWLNGEALFLLLSKVSIHEITWIPRMVLIGAGIGTIAVQLANVLHFFSERLSRWVLLSNIALHLVIFFYFELYLFSLLVIGLNLIVFTRLDALVNRTRTRSKLFNLFRRVSIPKISN